MSWGAGLLWAASGLSAATLVLHVIAGGRDVVRPMMKADFDHEAKWTAYFCWHMVTITLAGMSLAYGAAALDATAVVLALAVTILSLAYAALSLWLAVARVGGLFALPQWTLFAGIGGLGALGLFWGSS